MIDVPPNQAQLNLQNQQREQQNFSNNLLRPRSCTKFALAICLTKICFGIYVIVRFLNDPAGVCGKNILYWFIGMLIHDLFNFFILIKIIIFNAKLKKFLNNPQDFIRGSGNTRNNNMIVEYMERLAIENEKLKNDERSIDCLYYLLLVWGSTIYFVISCADSFIYDVFLTFEIMAFCVIFLPAILCCGLCLCAPCILCLIRFLPPIQQGPAPARNTANLKFKKSQDVLFEDGDEKLCGICFCEYELNEDVVILTCNNKHHFHKDCITKWIKINGSCPKCRKRVDEPTQ